MDWDDNHIIWSNTPEHTNLENWIESLNDVFSDYSDDELYEMMYENLAENLIGDRINLDIQLSQPILVIADLELRNHRQPAYREIESGNIRDCLYFNSTYITWFVDKDGDLRCDDIHQNGTNHYLYRVWKEGVSDSQKKRLKEKILNESVTRKDLSRLTLRLGDEIGKIYGWVFPLRPRERGEVQ